MNLTSTTAVNCLYWPALVHWQQLAEQNVRLAYDIFRTQKDIFFKKNLNSLFIIMIKLRMLYVHIEVSTFATAKDSYD